MINEPAPVLAVSCVFSHSSVCDAANFPIAGQKSQTVTAQSEIILVGMGLIGLAQYFLTISAVNDEELHVKLGQ